MRVTDKMGRSIQCQVSPVWVSPGAMSASRYEVSFLVNVPAFGLNTYIIHSLHGSNLPKLVTVSHHLKNKLIF